MRDEGMVTHVDDVDSRNWNLSYLSAVAAACSFGDIE